jgi:small subunit ribosomal protein S3
VGQKVHPKSFRLITTQKHLSTWYSTKNNYSQLLEEDYFIRTNIEKLFENFLTISNIKISRTNSKNLAKNYTVVTIVSLFPREKEISRKLISYLENVLKSSQKIKNKYLTLIKENLKGFTRIFLLRVLKQFKKLLQIKYSKPVFFNFEFIKNQFYDSMLIAKFIGNLIEKRIPYRRILNIVFKKSLLTEIKGIKIQIAGRLNGTDIARTEWKREGKISLHTLKSNIDYAQYSQKSIYGIFGIKVWILK